jgi:hypothetical protein
MPYSTVFYLSEQRVAAEMMMSYYHSVETLCNGAGVNMGLWGNMADLIRLGRLIAFRFAMKAVKLMPGISLV